MVSPGIPPSFSQTTIWKAVAETSFRFAGNVIFLKSTEGNTQIVMSKSAYNSFSKSQISEIEKIGNIIYSPIPTIEKHSGGSVRCMIAEIF